MQFIKVNIYGIKFHFRSARSQSFCWPMTGFSGIYMPIKIVMKFEGCCSIPKTFYTERRYCLFYRSW